MGRRVDAPGDEVLRQVQQHLLVGELGAVLVAVLDQRGHGVVGLVGRVAPFPDDVEEVRVELGDAVDRHLLQCGILFLYRDDDEVGVLVEEMAIFLGNSRELTVAPAGRDGRGRR